MVNDETSPTLLSNKEHTNLLIADIKDALDNAEYSQVIHEAVVRSGLLQRLGLQSDAAAAAAAVAPSRQGGMNGSATSRSTITLNTGLEADQCFAAAMAVAAPGAVQMRRSNRSEGDTELKQQVESLLQRTDSILSRSSGHSTSIQKSPAEAPLQRRRTTANYFTPGGAARQQQPRRTSAAQDSLGSTPGARSPANGNGSFSPESDSLPATGDGAAAGVGGFSGLSPWSAGDGAAVGALGLRNHVRRLSQHALSEAADRFDNHATTTLAERGELEQQRRVFDSGFSADRTTLVLGRSASWQVAAGRAAKEGPYADFGPLADLVDSVVADTSGPAAAAAAEGTTGGLLATSPTRTSAAAVDHSGSSKGRVPHKVALGYMLLPEYVQTAALNRLKASMASMSAAQPQLLPASPGGSQFELLLLALTARLSQWPQMERQAEQVFEPMLFTMLDNIFARLSPSRGGAPPPGRERGAPAGATISQGAPPISSFAAVSGAAAAADSSSCSRGLSGAVLGSSTVCPEHSARSSAAWRASSAGQEVAATAAAAAAEPAAVPVKLSDSMVRAAFAKLALGQAMLRGMPGKAAKVTQQQQLEQEQQPKPKAAPSNEKQPAAATGPHAVVEGDGDMQPPAESDAGTPDVGLTPALSTAASSMCSSQCLTFNRLASKHEQTSPGRLQQGQHGQQQQQQQQGAVQVQRQQALQSGQAACNSSSNSTNCRHRTTHNSLTAAAGQMGGDCTQYWQQQQLHPPQLLSAKVDCQQQWHVPGEMHGSCSSQKMLHTQPGSHVPATTSSRSPASRFSDAAISSTWQPPPPPQQQQQQLSQQGQQMRSRDSSVRDHQQQRCVTAGGSWLLPEQRQQLLEEGRQQLAQCAGLGAWLPSVGSISPGKAAMLSRSSYNMLTQASCGNHQQQQQNSMLWMHSPSHLSSEQVYAANLNTKQHRLQLSDQQQQLLVSADQAEQLLPQFQRQRKSVLPHRVSSVPDLQRRSNQQQHIPCSRGSMLSASTRTAGGAVTAQRATISKTLAGMQQQHDQEQQQRQQQQQQMLTQPWLQPKHVRSWGGQSCRGSPGSTSSSPGPAGSWQVAHGSPTCAAASEVWPSVLQEGLSTTVRVSAAGAQAALSPCTRHSMRMPLNGGCVDVHTDGVEVRSTNMLVISVSSSPTQPHGGGTSMTVAEAERSPAAQLSHGYSPARVLSRTAKRLSM